MAPWTGVLLVALASLPAAQDRPPVCPYCRGETARLSSAGLVSHGPFPFAKDDSDRVRAALGGDYLFLESAHFRIGSSLESCTLSDADERKVRLELAALRKSLPAVPAKARILDPWLRLHLFAFRAERFYERFQRLLGVTDADFAETPSPTGKYMGEGRYLGEKEKYELLLHERQTSHTDFLVRYTGTRVLQSERWHFQERHAIHLSVPCVGTLSRERALYGHVAHGLSHMLLSGYRHYSYEAPLWLDEGLAHWLEKEIEPASNTFDGDENTAALAMESEDWRPLALRAIDRRRAEPLAGLVRTNAFADLDRDDNVVCWSKVDFLLRTRPKEFAALVDRVKGRLDEKGLPSGRDLAGVQRDGLKELLGWTFADFDREWEAWARKTYAAK